MDDIKIGTIVRLSDDGYTNYMVEKISDTKQPLYHLKSQVYYKPDVIVKRHRFEVYLTLEDGLKMQRDGLNNWKAKLNAAIYSDLEAVMLASNEGKINPYDINRGQTLDTFIANWKPGKPLNEIYF